MTEEKEKNMRSTPIVLLVGALGFILCAASAANAQPPVVTYNYDRAYRHFVNSRYSYRVLYSPVAGYESVRANPYGYESRFSEPGYIEQRITPFGYERYDAVGGRGGMTMTPFGINNYYVPGYGSSFFVPWAR